MFGVVAVVACAAAGIYIIFSQYADTVDQLVKIFICFALVLADAGYIFAYVYWCKGLGSGWYAGIGIAGVVLFPIVAVLAVVVFVLCIILFFLRGAIPVIMATRIHLFPFRTQKLSSSTAKVLDHPRSGRIASCRISIKNDRFQAENGHFSCVLIDFLTARLCFCVA